MNENKFSQEEINNIIQLYQQLTLEQCKELFLRQKDTFNNKLKTSVYVLIAAKYVYGDEYVPNKNRPVKKEK